MPFVPSIRRTRVCWQLGVELRSCDYDGPCGDFHGRPGAGCPSHRVKASRPSPQCPASASLRLLEHLSTVSVSAPWTCLLSARSPTAARPIAFKLTSNGGGWRQPCCGSALGRPQAPNARAGNPSLNPGSPGSCVRWCDWRVSRGSNLWCRGQLGDVDSRMAGSRVTKVA